MADSTDLAGRAARELSYGQLRLALVARAFVRSRRLWLLDEPFDGLDARGATAVAGSGWTPQCAVARPSCWPRITTSDVPGYVTRVLTLRRGRAPVSA